MSRHLHNQIEPILCDTYILYGDQSRTGLTRFV